LQRKDARRVCSRRVVNDIYVIPLPSRGSNRALAKSYDLGNETIHPRDIQVVNGDVPLTPNPRDQIRREPEELHVVFGLGFRRVQKGGSEYCYHGVHGIEHDDPMGEKMDL